jgi:hypothetical protein
MRGKTLRRGERGQVRVEQRFPGFGKRRENSIRRAVRLMDYQGMVNRLAVKQGERQRCGNAGITGAGVGSEIFFGENGENGFLKRING